MNILRSLSLLPMILVCGSFAKAAPPSVFPVVDPDPEFKEFSADDIGISDRAIQEMNIWTTGLSKEVEILREETRSLGPKRTKEKLRSEIASKLVSTSVIWSDHFAREILTDVIGLSDLLDKIAADEKVSAPSIQQVRILSWGINAAIALSKFRSVQDSDPDFSGFGVYIGRELMHVDLGLLNARMQYVISLYASRFFLRGIARDSNRDAFADTVIPFVNQFKKVLSLPNLKDDRERVLVFRDLNAQLAKAVEESYLIENKLRSNSNLVVWVSENEGK